MTSSILRRIFEIMKGGEIQNSLKTTASWANVGHELLVQKIFFTVRWTKDDQQQQQQQPNIIKD